MPTLHWIGKEKVVSHHLDVPFKTLEKQYTFKDRKESKEETSENKIIHGDNLEALKSLLPEYEGKIKCIYIDPPYNTGNEGWVYNDNVNHPKIKKWLGDVVGKEGEDLSRHDKWLCMMYPRLKLLHKLLSDDGAIFISIDDNELHSLKLLLEEIFGSTNYVCELVWKRRSGANDAKNFISVDHEYILVFSKTSKFKFKGTEKDTSRYKNIDNDPRGPWARDNLTCGKTKDERPNLFYSIEDPKTGRVFFADPNHVWRFEKSKMNDLINVNKIIFPGDDNKRPHYKRHLSELRSAFKPVSTLMDQSIQITNIKTQFASGLNTIGTRELRAIFGKQIFDYPKTKELVMSLIFQSTNNNDIILDSFAGSGTTAHAVLNLNKEDGGNRKFILIEMEDYANDITAERVKRVIKGYGEGKKEVEGTGGDFEYLKLGKPLFDEDSYINEDQSLEDIRKYVYYSETKTNTGYSANPKNKYYLGKRSSTGYYFYYKEDAVTTLDLEFASKIKIKADQYIIYADKCTLSQDYMRENNIIFKKIPRDIAKI